MANTTINCRSILCSPILKEVDFVQANFDSDAILFDLEDSIPLDKKEHARQQLASKLKLARSLPYKPKVFIRINSVRSKDGIVDLLALLASQFGPDIIHLPKVETKEEIDLVHQLILHYFPDTKLQVIIETAKGLSAITDILKSLHYIHGLVFGAADFAADIGTDISWSSLQSYRIELVKIAKLNNLTVIDSPYFDYLDEPGLIKEIALSYDLGFDGKIAIHPCQIGAINKGFLPTLEEVLEALEILEEASKQSQPIFRFKGRMIGPPMLNCARRVVSSYNYFNPGKQLA
jgi:(S)-citramalyl-CoA lyase